MKKLLVLLMALAFAASFCACGPKLEAGSQLAHNVARTFTKEDRISHFIIDGREVGGSMTGYAVIDASADGRTALAEVNSISVAFVSEAGVDMLGTSVFNAEISFDGKVACYVDGENFMLYSVDSRSGKVLAENIYAVKQIAISPSSRCIGLSALYTGDGEKASTVLIKDGVTTPILEDVNASIIAVSDDGSLYYYIDRGSNDFWVCANGERKLISEEFGANSVFNFTRDLSEVSYLTAAGVNMLFRLEDGSNRELCEGFGFTLKTNIYSISRGEVPVYINDVDSFLSGLFVRYKSLNGERYYDVGLVGDDGAISWLVEDCRDYQVIASQGRILSTLGSVLRSTDLKGKTKQLATDVVSFKATEDGKYTYYQSAANSLFMIKGTGNPKRIETGVSSFALLNGYCFYICGKPAGEELETAGKLMRTDGKNTVDMGKNAVRFDTRAGQLLVYTDPAGTGDEVTYGLAYTSDGENFTAEFTGVEP
jgi:hypothetical protein